MKKILMVTQNFYPEIGSASNRMKIYLELNERGYDVKILTSDPSYPNRNLYKDSSYWYDENRKDIVRIHPKTRKYTRNLFRRLILYIEVAFRLILAICKDKEKYDYICFHTIHLYTCSRDVCETKNEGEINCRCKGFMAGVLNRQVLIKLDTKICL